MPSLILPLSLFRFIEFFILPATEVFFGDDCVEVISYSRLYNSSVHTVVSTITLFVQIYNITDIITTFL